MGMPRHLSNKLKDLATDFLESKFKIMSPLDYAWWFYEAGLLFGVSRYNQLINHTSSIDSILYFSLAYSLKCEAGMYRNRDKRDYLARVKIDYFIHFEESSLYSNGWKPVYRLIKVPCYFKEKAIAISAKREETARKEIEWRETVMKVRENKYGRLFPKTLRAIIFERDNYTCQVCLKTREVLLKEGLHLQCDHIVAWEDGGDTCYDNGQTLCSGCNKSKHHSKKYLRSRSLLTSNG